MGSSWGVCHNCHNMGFNIRLRPFCASEKIKGVEGKQLRRLEAFATRRPARRVNLSLNLPLYRSSELPTTSPESAGSGPDTGHAVAVYRCQANCLPLHRKHIEGYRAWRASRLNLGANKNNLWRTLKQSVDCGKFSPKSLVLKFPVRQN